jgi:hypothetical protein
MHTDVDIHICIYVHIDIFDMGNHIDMRFCTILNIRRIQI